MYILNAFSANMLVGGFPASVKFTEITAAKAADMAEGAVSAVGHADTAALFSRVLGVEVAANRATVALYRGNVAILGQYSGPRLPEGTTELPAGAKITWLLVEVS